jgi:hypothetical protein
VVVLLVVVAFVLILIGLLHRFLFYYRLYRRFFYQKNTMRMVRRSIPIIDRMARRRLCESEDRDKG